MNNSYTSDIPKYGVMDVCDPPKEYYTDADLIALSPGGLGTETLIPDPDTGRIPKVDIQNYVDNLTAQNIIKNRPMQNMSGSDVAESETDMSALIRQDAELFNKLRGEYCYYEQRYKFALLGFLKKATSRSQSDNPAAQQFLEQSRILNLRLNSVLEIMNFFAQDRVGQVVRNKADIDASNININKRLENLKKSYNFLTQEDTIVKTQKEMVRYTEEKNNYTANQIATWVTLNIMAIGAIFFVYRS